MSDTTEAPTSLVSNEPVLVAHGVLWVLVNLGAFVVGHTHLVTSSQWSSLSTFLVPIITAAVLSVSAVVIRKYVSPFWKVLLKDAGKVGIDTALLTGTKEVQAFFADLGLDSEGNPLPVPVPEPTPAPPAPTV